MKRKKINKTKINHKGAILERKRTTPDVVKLPMVVQSRDIVTGAMDAVVLLLCVFFS